MIVFLLIVIVGFVLLIAWGSKSAERALKSDRIFIPFDDSIHERNDQRERIKRAVEHDLSVKTILSNNYAGKIIGTTGNIYDTSLRFCTCQDFKRRRLPCKHMYFFACKSGRCEICEGENGFEIYKII